MEEEINPISEDTVPLSPLGNERRNQQAESGRRFSIASQQVQSDGDHLVISPEDIPDEYEQSDEKTGLLVIFNHEKFCDNDDREGTVKDEEDLIDCLSRLRYEINKNFIFKDLNKNEIKTTLSEISNMDHTNRNSLIVVFLTHGSSGGKLSSSDGDYITCEEVWNYFSANKCPTLRGKPKIFIFQACKGDNKSSASGIQEDSMTRAELAQKSYTLPAESDILISYSTVEGNKAFRHSKNGSWFIQELCSNLTAYGRRDDFVTIITRMSKCVAYHYQHQNFKQMPSFISTLTRKFYICKSKDRGLLLELREQQKHILEDLNWIKNHLIALQLDTKQNTKEVKEKSEFKSPATGSRTIKKSSSASKVSTTSTPEKPRWK